MEKEYFTPKEISVILNVSDRTVYAWIRTGRIRALNYRINRKIISREELRKFVEKYNF